LFRKAHPEISARSPIPSVRDPRVIGRSSRPSSVPISVSGAVAAVSELADVDAITLSSLRPFNTG
jgi:hypothetical protein